MKATLRDKPKSAINKSRWNLKICSGNLKKGKEKNSKRKREQRE